MDDALVVQVLQAQGHLVTGQPQDFFVDFATEQLGGLPVLAELKQQVVVLLILNVADQLDDIGVVEF